MGSCVSRPRSCALPIAGWSPNAGGSSIRSCSVSEPPFLDGPQAPAGTSAPHPIGIPDTAGTLDMAGTRDATSTSDMNDVTGAPDATAACGRSVPRRGQQAKRCPAPTRRSSRSESSFCTLPFPCRLARRQLRLRLSNKPNGSQLYSSGSNFLRGAAGSSASTLPGPRLVTHSN